MMVAPQEGEAEQGPAEQGRQAEGDRLMQESLGRITGTDWESAIARTVPGTAVPLPAPKEPTAAERERHMITHLPYASWCPYCISGRRPNCQHRRVINEQSLPTLHADYGFF